MFFCQKFYYFNHVRKVASLIRVFGFLLLNFLKTPLCNVYGYFIHLVFKKKNFGLYFLIQTILHVIHHDLKRSQVSCHTRYLQRGVTLIPSLMLKVGAVLQ